MALAKSEYSAPVRYLAAHNAVKAAERAKLKLNLQEQSALEKQSREAVERTGHISPWSSAASHTDKAIVRATAAMIVLGLGIRLGVTMADAGPIAELLTTGVVGSLTGSMTWSAVHHVRAERAEGQSTSQQPEQKVRPGWEQLKAADDEVSACRSTLAIAKRDLIYEYEPEPDADLVEFAKALIANDSDAIRDLAAIERTQSSGPNFAPPGL